MSGPPPHQEVDRDPRSPIGQTAGNERSRPPSHPFEQDEVSLLALVNVLLRHSVALVAIPAAALFLAVILVLLRSPQFTAESVFMPEQGSTTGGRLSGLAAQFGIDVAGGGAGESVGFYADLVRSRELLARAVATEYSVPTATGEPLTGDSVQLYSVEGETPEQRLNRAVSRLNEEVSVQTDQNTGLVTLQVRSRWPALAVALNRRLLELVNEFNLDRRQSQARSEREFLDERLGEARGELQLAEGALERFMERNRSFAESPQLSFEAARLQRRVDLQQQVYTSLAQAYEQARIEQVRNTPVITVIDPPERFVRQTAPQVLKTLLLALVLGGMAAITFAFVKEYAARQREVNPEEYADFVALRRRVLSPRLFRRPFGRFSRSADRNDSHGATEAARSANVNS